VLQALQAGGSRDVTLNLLNQYAAERAARGANESVSMYVGGLGGMGVGVAGFHRDAGLKSPPRDAAAAALILRGGEAGAAGSSGVHEQLWKLGRRESAGGQRGGAGLSFNSRYGRYD
jgi:hypothetical protein